MKKLGILDFRPTQFVLGTKEIESKIYKMSALSKKALYAYCADHIIPVVIGPKQEMYMIDHHHFVRACWEQKISIYSFKIVKDMSHMSAPDFWNFMNRKEWVYLNDQFGIGPHSPYSLPADIRCLADDPFRSLAWTIIDAGLIKKQDIPFFEFKWAAFFRRNIEVPLHSKSNFKSAIAAAKKLAKSAAAKDLPGYLVSR